MSRPDTGEPGVRARMPADVDTPDKILYGLTFRQLAVLATAAVIAYTGWRYLHTLVATPVLLGAGAVLAALTAGLVAGRRDGLGLDVWLLHALRHRHAPKTLSPLPGTGTHPGWVAVPAGRVTVPAPLRLPATAVDDDGQVSLTGARAAVTAATTVNLGLRTPEEQAALVDTFGRWLNSLTTPTQIVVSAQPVDLASHARALAARAGTQPHPALGAACAAHAEFLHELARRRDPLRRQVLIVTRTPTADGDGHAARRRAEDTARALSGLGVTARALDAYGVTAALAAAADPYHPPHPGRRAAPTTTITAAPAVTNRKGRTSP